MRGAARLAGSLGVSPIVVGLTIVSFGTSAPELVVSTLAALGGDTDLAVANVIGSNLANIGLILGLSALVRPLVVQARIVWRETPIVLGRQVTAGSWLVFLDGAGVGRRLAERLRAAGNDVAVVHEGDAYYRLSADEYSLSPEHGPSASPPLLPGSW